MAENINQLLKDMDRAGFVFKDVTSDPNTGATKINGTWLHGRNDVLLARMKAAKPQLIARLQPSPTKIRATVAKSASLPWLGRLNKAANSLLEPDPTKHPYLHWLYPSSATGKALMAVPAVLSATTGLPETIGGAAMLGAEIAGIAGGLSGEIKNKTEAVERMGEGAASLALPQALGEIPGAIQLLRYKHEIVADLDAKTQGEFIDKALSLPRVSKMLNRGLTWVSALKDSFTQKEAWQRMSGKLDQVHSDLQLKVQDQIDALKQAFQQKYGLGKNMLSARGQMQANKQMLKDFMELKGQVSKLRSIPSKYKQSLQALKGLGKQGYDKGAFRSTKSGIEAVQSYDDIQSGLRAVLSGGTKDLPFHDPTLLQMYDEANSEYKQFGAFRDLARNGKLLTTDFTGKGNLPTGKINTPVLQKIIRDYPEKYQNRLGPLWDDFKSIVRRGEVDTENIDVPGNVPTLRNTSGHVRGSGITGFVRNAIPYRGQYLGETPSLLGKDAVSVAQRHVPAPLIIGGAATGGNMQDITAENPDNASGQ